MRTTKQDVGGSNSAFTSRGPATPSAQQRTNMDTSIRMRPNMSYASIYDDVFSKMPMPTVGVPAGSTYPTLHPSPSVMLPINTIQYSAPPMNVIGPTVMYVYSPNLLMPRANVPATNGALGNALFVQRAPNVTLPPSDESGSCVALPSPSWPPQAVHNSAVPVSPMSAIPLSRAPIVAAVKHEETAAVTLASAADADDVSASSRGFPCNWKSCNSTFSTRFSLKRHQKKHMGARPYPCPHGSCGHSFAEKSTLKRHIRTHTGERPFECPFSGCEKRFADRTNVRRHALAHTRHPNGLLCPGACGSLFQETEALSVHLVSAHQYSEKEARSAAQTIVVINEGLATGKGLSVDEAKRAAQNSLLVWGGSKASRT